MTARSSLAQLLLALGGLAAIALLATLPASCSETPDHTSDSGGGGGRQDGSASFKDGPGGGQLDGGLQFDQGGGGGRKDTGGTPPPTSKYFPAGNVWQKDVSNAPLDSQSGTIISALAAAGGWGNGNVFQIAFDLVVLQADSSTPLRSFTPTSDHFSPDCDIAQVPVPAGGAIEEEAGYTCTKDGDCHLIVVHKPTKKLFEMWRANISNASGVGGTFRGGCLAIWDLSRIYPPAGRGEHCTSADAAGFPIAPLLFTADEVKAGVINHALRFILPNARIRSRVYVRPATHSTNGASGGANMPPYGALFRLKKSFDLSRFPNNGARVVARALQKYGMLLSDAGSIVLSGENDRFTTAKWSGLLGARDLDILKVTDFEMVEGGQRITWTGDCKYSGTP